VTTEEMNAVRIDTNIWTCTSRKTLENRKQLGDKGLLSGAGIVKVNTTFRLKLYGHVEKMQNQTAKTNCNNREQGKLEDERRRNFVENGLNIMGIKKADRQGQRPSGIEEDSIGNQDLQRIIVLAKSKKKNRICKGRKLSSRKAGCMIRLLLLVQLSWSAVN
jgi:hypothetical protein